MGDYKQLIKKWVIKKNEEGIVFKHEGDVVAEYTISTMFFEQIIKKSLARLVWVAGDKKDQSSTELERLASLIQMFESIYDKAISPSFPFSELTDDEEELVKQMPVEIFGSWVLYMLENDVLKNASNLENVFRGETSF